MGFVQGEGRTQGTLFPVTLEELIADDHLCRVIDVFVARLDMAGLGFERAEAAETGRPGDWSPLPSCPHVASGLSPLDAQAPAPPPAPVNPGSLLVRLRAPASPVFSHRVPFALRYASMLATPNPPAPRLPARPSSSSAPASASAVARLPPLLLASVRACGCDGAASLALAIRPRAKQRPPTHQPPLSATVPTDPRCPLPIRWATSSAVRAAVASRCLPRKFSSPRPRSTLSHEHELFDGENRLNLDFSLIFLRRKVANARARRRPRDQSPLIQLLRKGFP
jgi:hypothetical protein